jgi:hypothetical protein
MVAFSMRFDPIEYAKQLRSVGFSQEQADVQAQTMERVMETAVNLTREEVRTQDSAAKKDLFIFQAKLEKGIEELRAELKKDIAGVKADLELKMAKVENNLLKWALSIGISSCVVLIGAMATFFKLYLH